MSAALDHRADSTESVALAAQGVLDAGERIAFDWLELLRAEWTEKAREFARDFATLGAGILLVACAWILATAALVVGLDRWLTLDASFAVVAAAEGSLGALLLGRKRRRRVAP